MKNIEFSNCKCCNTEYVVSNSKYHNACSQECFKSMKKVDLKLKSLKSIKTVSNKRKIEDAEYKILRQEFLSKPENKICPITKWPTNEVHHKRSFLHPIPSPGMNPNHKEYPLPELPKPPFCMSRTSC